MARFRIGPVRVGGGRRASITGGVGPIGVTLGGRRKSSRSRGSSGSDDTSGDTYSDSYEESPAERHQRECHNRVVNHIEDGRLFDPENEPGTESFGWVMWGLFVTWAMLTAFTFLNLAHLSRSIWLTFLFLAFAQTVSSPVENFLPKKNVGFENGDWASNKSPIDRFSIGWAHARVTANKYTGPVVFNLTMVPIILNLSLIYAMHHYGIAEGWLSSNSNVPSTFIRAFIAYWIITTFLTSTTLKTKYKMSNDDVSSAIRLLFLNFVGVAYASRSNVRLTLIRHRLGYVNAYIDTANDMGRNDPSFMLEIGNWLAKQKLLREIESMIVASRGSKSSSRTKTEYSKTVEANLSHLGPRSSRLEKPDTDFSASTSRSTKSPTNVQQPSPKKKTSTVTNKPTKPSNSRPLSYLERLQMTSDERDGKSASDF